MYTCWKAVQTSGLLSDGDIYFIDGFDNIKKLQFWIHADKFMKTAAQHSKKANLVISQFHVSNRKTLQKWMKHLLP